MVTVGAALLSTELLAVHCIQAEAVEPVKEPVAAHSQEPARAEQKPVAPAVAASAESDFAAAAAAAAPFAAAALVARKAAFLLAPTALVAEWEVE